MFSSEASFPERTASELNIHVISFLLLVKMQSASVSLRTVGLAGKYSLRAAHESSDGTHITWRLIILHPSTARVGVNRIWQYHFGVGIVATEGNFGQSGDRSHYKLEYLSSVRQAALLPQPFGDNGKASPPGIDRHTFRHPTRNLFRQAAWRSNPTAVIHWASLTMRGPNRSMAQPRTSGTVIAIRSPLRTNLQGSEEIAPGYIN
jgi:hypothetical protein